MRNISAICLVGGTALEPPSTQLNFYYLWMKKN